MFNNTIKIALFLCVALLLTHFLPSSVGAADKALLEDVVVVRDEGLKVSFVVRDAINEDIKEAIESGISTSFTFIIKLKRERRFWRDKSVEKWTFNHTVKYDNLKDEYEVYLEETGKKKVVKDFNEMVELMVTGKNIHLAQIPDFKDGAKYILRIKAQLDTVKLPLHLDYILLFVKLWDFETPWYTYKITS